MARSRACLCVCEPGETTDVCCAAGHYTGEPWSAVDSDGLVTTFVRGLVERARPRRNECVRVPPAARSENGEAREDERA